MPELFYITNKENQEKTLPTKRYARINKYVK